MAERPDRLDTHRIDLTDGRKVHVLEYDDGSVRIRISDPPYLLKECYLQASGDKDHAIIKLVPDSAATKVTPEKSKTGYKWTRSEFTNGKDANAYAKQALSEDLRIEGPIAPKAGLDHWVVWSTPM